MPSAGPIGVYKPFRFDASKVVLPPILGGPVIDDRRYSSQPVTFQSLKRKRDFEHSGFHNFQEALQRATENELNFALKQVRIVYGGSCSQL